MKAKVLTLVVLFLGLSGAALDLAAAPIAFDEVSLLVRVGDRDDYILRQVASRRLVHPLSASQEAALRASGASETLVHSLRAATVQLGEEEAAAFERQQAQNRAALARSLAADEVARERAQRAALSEARERETARLATEQAETRRRSAEAAASLSSDAGSYYPDYVGYASPGYGFAGGSRGHFQSGAALPPHDPGRSGSARLRGESAFRPSPIGTGDRSVLSLSGNAVFVPAR